MSKQGTESPSAGAKPRKPCANSRVEPHESDGVLDALGVKARYCRKHAAESARSFIALDEEGVPDFGLPVKWTPDREA